MERSAGRGQRIDAIANTESDEDQKEIMVYFGQRELELRQAIQTSSWLDMRAMPGITTLGLSRFSALLADNASRMDGPPALAYSVSSYGLARRAAEVETQRRLAVTALALARYQARHGSYPDSLTTLIPEFLATKPSILWSGHRLALSPGGKRPLYPLSTGPDCMTMEGK